MQCCQFVLILCIKRERQCFIEISKKRVENTTRSGVFLTTFAQSKHKLRSKWKSKIFKPMLIDELDELLMSLRNIIKRPLVPV